MLFSNRFITSPTEVSGCCLWLDAAQGVSTNATGSVSQWNDLSSNNNHAVQADNTARPTLITVSGKSVIQFDGTSDYLRTTNNLTETEQTIFVIGRYWGTPASYAVLIITRQNAVYAHLAGANNWGVFTSGASGEQPAGELMGASFRCFTIRRRNDSNSNIRLSTNGIVKALWSSNPLRNGTVTDIGGSPAGSQFAAVDLAEVVVFSRVLSDAETKSIEDYLNKKYKLFSERFIEKPTEFSNCSLWLDASDVSSITQDVTGSVSQWNDKSGNSRHATNTASVSTKPSYSTTNGVLCLKFLNANDSHLDLPAGIVTAGDSAHTAFIVGQRTTGSGGTNFLAWLRLSTTTSTRSNSVIGVNNSTGQSYFGAASVSIPNGDSLVTGETVILSKRYVPSTQNRNNNITGRIQGISASGSDVFTLGDSAGMLGFSSGGASANFNACEVIVFTRTLSDAEMILVEQYLSRKWNIS